MDHKKPKTFADFVASKSKESNTDYRKNKDQNNQDRGDRDFRPSREKPNYGDDGPRKFDGDRKPRFGDDGPRKFDGDRKPRFGEDGPRKFEGDRKPRFGDDGPRKFDGDRKPRFGDDGPRKFDGDRKPRFGEDGPRKFDGDRKPRFGDDGPRKFDGDRKPRFGDDGPRKFDGDRKPRFGDDGPRKFDGDRKPRYGDDAPRKFDGDRKPRFGDDRSHKSKKPTGKSFFESSGFHDKKRSKDDAILDSVQQTFKGSRSLRGMLKTKADDLKRFSQTESVWGMGKQSFSDFLKSNNPNKDSKTEETPKTKEWKPSKNKAEAAEDKIIRLNKFIAHAGICSRRNAAELVKNGEIKVNGEVQTDPSYVVQDSDVIVYNKKEIKIQEKTYYYLMNKPKNVITTTSDERGRVTVMDLIKDNIDARIFPVGRLDRNTTGLLLLTNDGDLATRLSHPAHKVKKIYHVVLDKPVSAADIEKIAQGLELEDGVAEVDAVDYIIDAPKTEVGIEIHIGKNRIVRRIFEHLGYEVKKLDRTYYGGLTKKDLPRGFSRPLTEQEIIMLKHFVGHPKK